MSTSRSPGTPTPSSVHSVAPGSRVLTMTFLRVSAAVNVAPQPEPVDVRDQRLDGRRVRGVVHDRLGLVLGRLLRRRGRRHGLDVGGVARGGGAHVGVLARRAGREELLGRRAAHGPRHRRDDLHLEPEPGEDPLVGLAVRVVGRLQGLVGEVERVRVLHRELAPAQDARARALLVAVLGLDLVEDHREVAVGAGLPLDHEGEHLLVRGPEQVVGLLAVLEAEERVAVLGPAPGGLVGLLRQQRREVHLLAADRVHLLADDRLDPGQHLHAQRQPRVDAGRDATDVPGAHEQLVAETSASAGSSRSVRRNRPDIRVTPRAMDRG